jgi:hypothetical protein
MEVSGQLHAPAALTPGKEPPAPIEQEGRWAPESVWVLWRREKSCTKRTKIKGQNKEIKTHFMVTNLQPYS